MVDAGSAPTSFPAECVRRSVADRSERRRVHDYAALRRPEREQRVVLTGRPTRIGPRKASASPGAREIVVTGSRFRSPTLRGEAS